MSARGSVRGAAAALLALAPLGAAAGCSSAPQPTPEITPTAAAALLDERIALPTTMGLAFTHPRPGSRIEHQVLYTVQQAVRAQLHAEYGLGAYDPLLSDYWSGGALTAVRSDAASWVQRNEQPVGVLVVGNTTYTPPDAAGDAPVTYCANWVNVLRGNAVTHVVGSAVQKAGTAGTSTTLTLSRGVTGRWRVSDLIEAAHSAECAASK
jgi:hypothetical protein